MQLSSFDAISNKPLHTHSLPSPHTHSNQRWQRFTRWKTCLTPSGWAGLSRGPKFHYWRRPGWPTRSNCLPNEYERRERNYETCSTAVTSDAISLRECHWCCAYCHLIETYIHTMHMHTSTIWYLQISTTQSVKVVTRVCATETMALMFSFFAYFSPPCRMQIEFETFMV